jgi:anti-sigma factor ChrR (cupin superfamily)
MSNDDTDLLAAEYALGTLDARTREQVARELPTNFALQDAVRTWEYRLAALAGGERPVDPPTGLWEKIEAALDDAEAEPYGLTIHADERHWSTLIPGVEKKVLFVDQTAGYESYLLRLAPGARIPAHPHAMTEECVVLEGELSIGDLRVAAGDYHMVSAGTTHPVVYTEKGALIYLRGELRAAAR